MTEQAGFIEALLDPETPVPPGLISPDGQAATRRFDVYRNNVATGLVEALEQGFPVIRKLVGQANFRLLARAYLREHPPQSPLLMYYGEGMPVFLEGFGPTREIGYLPDVARLELAVRQSYHAADSKPIEAARLQIPTERLMAASVRLAPSIRLVRSVWPIHGIWRFNMESGVPKPQARGENVLVSRPEFDPRTSTLAPGGDRFVAALMDGARFGEALDAALAEVPEFDLTNTLEALLNGAAITELNEGN